MRSRMALLLCALITLSACASTQSEEATSAKVSSDVIINIVGDVHGESEIKRDALLPLKKYFADGDLNIFNLETAITEEVKKEEAAAKAKEEAKKAAAEEKRAAALRSENLKRMQGMAGATGDENAKGTALKSSGPSASYAGRIRARIKPNITFTDDVAGNPKAEVEVKTSPDGTILSRKLLSSSGNKAWDEAVLKAIDKTAVLPRDEDGRVPPVLEISFRPKD